MAEDLAKTIVQAASIMEQKQKVTKIATLYLDHSKGDCYYFRGDCCSYDFGIAFNYALYLGYIPVEHNHPAKSMIHRCNTKRRTIVGVFKKAE